MEMHTCKAQRTRLRFVADDYGEGPTTNRRIEEIANYGLVRCTTVVASSETHSAGFHTSEAGRKLGWGAHLFLTGYPPFSTSLRRLAGRRGVLTKMEIFRALVGGRLNRREIAEEFSLQLEMLVKQEYQIEFLDTHQNIHSIPAVFHGLHETAARCGLTASIRPTIQLDFSLSSGFRPWLSWLTGWVTQKDRSSRVLVGCPGYQRETVDLASARAQWSAFLAKLGRHRYGEIVVPVHPGLSPAEMAIYGDPFLIAMLGDWL